MSSGDLTSEEASRVVSCLLRCAIVFGYRPTYRDLSKRGMNATIARLTSFLIESRGEIEEEAMRILKELGRIRVFRRYAVRKYGRSMAGLLIHNLYRVIELTDKLPSEVEISGLNDPGLVHALKRYREFLDLSEEIVCPISGGKAERKKCRFCRYFVDYGDAWDCSARWLE